MPKRVNCEDNSHKEGWSYCGKRECESCGIGGMKNKGVTNEAFNNGWALMKNFIGPREKVEEGKRMVEGDKVRYGTRKWDGVVVPEIRGYIDDEGNERDAFQGYAGLVARYPDADIRYRHDQDMSGERPMPYSWRTDREGDPYPASIRDKFRESEMRAHHAKMLREKQEARDEALRRRFFEKNRERMARQNYRERGSVAGFMQAIREAKEDGRLD